MFVPLLLVAVFLAKGVGLFIQKYLMSYCGLKVLERLRYELYAKIISLPLDFFWRNQEPACSCRALSTM